MFNNFKVYDDYKPKANKEVDNESKNAMYLRIGMVVSAILIFALIIYGLSKITKTDTYDNIKENRYENLVYTANYSTEDQKIPYINIKDFSKVNMNIQDITNKYRGKSNATINYKYNTSGIILSVIISILHDTDDVPILEFVSYNINLKTKGIILDKQLLNYYNLSMEDVNKKIQAKFQQHYIKEVKEGYIVKQECNFACYLDLRGNYDKYAYYVEKGNLYAYVPFDAYTIYGEEEYFKDKDFKMYLAEAPEE